MKRILFLAGLSILVANAGPKGWKLPAETEKLEPRPGYEIAAAQCILCHSADYIATQPVMNRAAWTATVTKMREKYGSPLPADNVTNVVDYLVTTYGAEKSLKK